MGQIMRKVPVLIVGGGPVVLALASDLGWRGIACVLIEQGDGTIVTPKMNGVNVRTMEFCRRWGIAGAVHACPFPPDYPRDVAFVTSLSGQRVPVAPGTLCLHGDQPGAVAFAKQIRQAFTDRGISLVAP